MKQKFMQFMQGRYGNDELNRFIAVLCFVILIISLLASALLPAIVGTILYFLLLTGLVIVYFRMFSKNTYKRANENRKYLKLTNKFRNKHRLNKEKWNQREEYKFFTCPKCHTTLRVPKGKGKINIVCRKCGYSFQGKT